MDPAAASRGYARALFVLGVLAAVLLVWLALRQSDALEIPAGLHTSARVMRRARSAPWTVAAALLALMTLGTTKRCFDFGRGTLAALGVVAAVLALGPLLASLVPAPAWLVGALVGLPAPALAAFLAGSVGTSGTHHAMPYASPNTSPPHGSSDVTLRRQALATSAWLALAFFVGLAAYEDLASAPALPLSDLRRLFFAGGTSVGAAFGAALPLRRLALAR